MVPLMPPPSLPDSFLRTYWLQLPGVLPRSTIDLARL